MRQFHQLVRFLLIVVMLTLSTSLPLAAQVSFFTPPTYYGSGTVFVGDFNGDGKPDILTNIGTMNLGKGDGTFTVETTIVGGVLAVGDFNGDGKPDVLQQGTGTLLALLGNGDGTFQPPISTNSGASLSSVIADDLNGDGKADVLGIFYNNLVVYIGNGDGTFAAGVSYSVGNASFSAEGIALSPVSSSGVIDAGSVITGDFNRDGKPDLAVVDLDVEEVRLLLGKRDGTFQTAASLFSGAGEIATGDFNGDGNLDLVFAPGEVLGGGRFKSPIEIYRGNGDGTFVNPSHYEPVYHVETGVSVADFNWTASPILRRMGMSFWETATALVRGIPL
jgi:hypothetical protein